MADYSINAVTRRVVFSGSAGTGPYAFTFEIIQNTDVAVYFNAALLTLTTDYTVTINANGTGSVTIVTGSAVPSTPTASDQITIVGSRDIERTTDFVTAGDFRASAINEQLDSQIIMIQQVAEENKRGMRAPVYDPALVEDGGVVDMTLPAKASRAGKTLAFDSDGNPVVGEDIGNWRGNWAASTAYTVRDLVKDASNYNVYRCNTAHTSSGTTPISSNADAAKWDLVVDAAYAATQASNAASSASAAATSASNAASSASAASTSASNAASSASSASTSASNASTSASSAASSASSASTSASNAASSASAAAASAASISLPLAIASGGTGSTTASGARTALGSGAVGDAVFLAATASAAQQAMDVEVGVDVQAYDADTAKTDVAQTWSAAQTFADYEIIRPKFKDYGETVNVIGSIGGGTQDIDLENGNVVSGTVDTSATTFTFSNPPPSGTEGGFKLYLTNGGSQTVNWPASVDWAGGTAPTLTTAGVDVLVFSTITGGTTWYGFAAGLDLK